MGAVAVLPRFDPPSRLRVDVKALPYRRPGPPPAFWAELVGALRQVGYDDVLSIENEDWMQDKLEGVAEAAAMMNEILTAG